LAVTVPLPQGYPFPRKARPYFAVYSSPEIAAYYPAGVVALLDGVPDHYDNVIDPISLGHAYGGNLGGTLIPDSREVFTKIDLLIMQAIGYPLRPIRAIAPLKAFISPIILSEVEDTMSEVVTFSGSLPYFNVSISKGVLPSGLNLNSFTGEIYGTPKEAGSFPITIKVEEYDVVGKSLEIETTLEISDGVTALVNREVNTQIKCYPNPANDFIYLEIDGLVLASAELEIYDLTGHRIFHWPITMADRKHKIPFAQQPPGVYFVILRTPYAVISAEIVIKQ